MASLKNLEAALLMLQAEALKHYGAIEILINNPTGISEHTDYVGEIIKHARGLSECEEAYGSLQKHFVPAAPAPPPTHTAPRPTQEGEIVVTPENSPTMRRATKNANSKKKRAKKND
jgi:hypothetical protein|tara:strand:- start:100 stop:450 length:351 start_codon:yes stop_codon:yes gene_type:complete